MSPSRFAKSLSWALCSALALAAQAEPRCPAPETIAARLSPLLNLARKQARDCGERRFPAAEPLRWSESLSRAAAAHAENMARRGYFAHQGEGEASPGERLSQAGFEWQSHGENIALGVEGLEEVVAAWLNSPSHCEVLMNAGFTHVGAACAEGRKGVYWVLEAASPAPLPAK